MSMDEVPAKIQPPEGIELRVSKVDKKRIGCFSLIPINKGTEFGPYEGRIVNEKDDETVDPRFSWEVFDLKTFKYVHTVDATNPAEGNWMRYVCCARYFEEQNIVSTQNGTDVYYRALKDIEAGEELLTWFQPKKKKRKRSLARNSVESADISDLFDAKSDPQTDVSDNTAQNHSKQKRRRKPKVIPDAYIGPLDWEDHEAPAKNVREDVFEPLQPGQKRRRRKKLPSDNVSSEATSPSGGRQDLEEDEDVVKPNVIKIEEKEFEKTGADDEKLSKMNQPSDNTIRKNSSSGDSRKEPVLNLSIAEINNSVEWEFPKHGEEYIFELKKHHVVMEKGKKSYKCDICLGLYKHMFSLKRHYLRNHVNYKYLSKSDMTNCLINLVQVKHLMRKKFPEEITSNECQKMKKHTMTENVDSMEVSRDISGEKDVDSMEVSRDISGEKENTVQENTDDIKLCEETSQNCVQETEACSQQIKGDDTSNSDQDPRSNEENSNGLIEETVSEVNDESSPNNCNESIDKCTSNLQLENMDSYTQKSNGASMKDVVKLTEFKPNKGNITEIEKEKAVERKENTLTNNPMPGLFRCYTCYLTFDDFEGIREHTQNHPEQMDGACFPCDLCSMRFNYKHNLVRHKKTHETEEQGKKSSTQVNGTHEKTDNLSPKKHLLPLKNQPLQEKKPLLLPSVFRCGICPQKFDAQSKVVKHVEEEHKIDSKFQCMYCGKDFQSMPNMKKHVRFHLGYRATCRICSEAFSNVGALRKHTRVSHPDIYKAKLIERLEKYGVLKGPDKNALSKDIIEKVNLSRKKLKETTEAADPAESIKKEVKADTKELEKEEEIDHEINFTADEIDDGGSRFKFACTVCKKRFSSYINMCRHRRKVHSNENRNRTEQCLTFGRKPRNNPSPVLENPGEIAAFYANVSHNIATNLNCYIDGKPESLKTFVDHIKVEGYSGNFGYNAENDSPLDLTWEKYNFPHDYKPVETISFADIKNVLNIHNDFDSHCVSVRARSAEGANKESGNQEDIEKTTGEVKNRTSAGDSYTYLKETKENTDKHVNDIVTDESIEDIEVREINSAWQSEEVESSIKGGNISEVVESDTMGKSSHGLKVLANIGSVLSKKGASSASCERKLQEVGGLYKVKVTNSTDSPAAKTFHQVKLGEYANFQDDLLSCDMDCPVAKRTQLASGAQYLKNGQCNIPSEESKNCHIHETEELEKEAQDQLEALYDSIENCEPVIKVYKKSPKSLSALCEKVLGLGPLKKEHKTGSSLNVEVASQLKLSTNDSKDQSIKDSLGSGPDYSDAPEESPFYNYETIEFGKYGHVEQVCAICKKHFPDFDALLRHHTKKHPATECSFLEVEQGHEIEDLHFSEPSYVGALAVTDPGLDNMSELESFKCTNCEAAFKTVSKLHVHIVICSSIDPMYGAQKTDTSPTKTPLKKKLQKKIFSMFGNKTEVKTDLNLSHFKLSQQRNDTQSPKRVFTGCRKRTSVILPDSPQKLVCEQKFSVPTVSGYNPQNHIRRRELTEILDTLTCEACGLKFKTIIILERHIKYCTKKEKFKSIQPMACPLMDESLEKIKNMCFYCNKNFTYTKSLLNHFQDFCPVKRARLDKGELTEQDTVKEKEIIERIQKADEEKALKQKEMENRPKRNMTWQVGRKSKRKGHSWTNIKKRSQPKQSPSGIGNTEGSEENEEFESSGSESEGEDGAVGASNSDTQTGSMELNEKVGNCASNASESSMSDIIGNAVKEACNKSETIKNICDDEVNENVQNVLSNKRTFDGEDKLTMDSCTAMFEEEATIAVSAVQEVLPSAEVTTAVSAQQDFMSSDEITNNESTDQSFAENEELVKLDTDVNNTSLNCTARYNVNQLKSVTKYRPIAPKPKASSVLFQCVSKKIPISKQFSPENKKEKEDNKNTIKVSTEVPIGLSGTCISNTRVNEPAQAKAETSFQLAQQGLVTGKRKRARVGKVEEFLRNAFKRKRKKIEADSQKSSASSGQVCSSFIILNPVFPSTNTLVDGEENADISSEKSELTDGHSLNRKQNIKHSVVKNQTEIGETTDELTRPSEKVCETRNLTSAARHNITFEQNQESEIQHKNGLGTSKMPQCIVAKRGRGRPRGSFTKKPDQNVTKSVQGRKRGRPRKVQLKGPSPNNDEVLETNPPSFDNSIDLIMDEGKGTEIHTYLTQSAGNTVEESYSGSDTDKVDMMGKNLKGENHKNGNNTDFTYSMNSENNENHMDSEGNGMKVASNSKAKPDSSCKNEDNSLANVYQGHDKIELESEAAVNDTEKASKGSTINDVETVDMLSESVETPTSVNDNIDEQHTYYVTDTSQVAEAVLETKYSPKQKRKHIKEMHTLHEEYSNVSNESFDEVDGILSENTLMEHKSGKLSFITDKQISETTALSNEYEQKHAEIISTSVPALGHCTDNNKMKDQALHSKTDELNKPDENCTAMSGFINEVEKLEGKGFTDSASLIERECEIQNAQEQSSRYRCPADKDKCESFMCNQDLQIGSEATLSENEYTVNRTDNLNSFEIEPMFSRDEPKAVKSNENNTIFEAVLSPSERVKMNKRSCKKDVDLTSPVWVKRTKLNKTRIEKKIEILNENVPEAERESDSVCTDAINFREKKRKVSESDSALNHTLNYSKQELFKGTAKKNAKVKKV